MMSYYDLDFNPKSIMKFLHLCENDLLGSILLTWGCLVHVFENMCGNMCEGKNI